MASKHYRIKVREEDIEVDIAGDKRFVKAAFSRIENLLKRKFKNVEMPKDEKPAHRKKPGRKKKPGPKSKKVKEPKRTPKKDRIDMSGITLEELFKVKDPKKENQRVLLLSYYLNKVKKRREFRPKDLEPLYAELKLDMPKNLSYYLRKMSEEKTGLIAHGKKNGRYKITDKGIDFIYDKIPPV